MSRPNLLLLFAIDLLALGCSGQDAASTRKEAAVSDKAGVRSAVAAINIIDHTTNRWWSSSKLYLKVESSREPGVAVLLPINVGRYAGQEQVTRTTPFQLHQGSGETLRLELLDDIHLTPEQEAKILGASEKGGTLFWMLGKVYFLREMTPYVPKNGPNPLGDFARATGEVLLDGLDRDNFQSFGTADYHVPDHPPSIFRDATAVTVKKEKQVKLDVRIYYPPADGKR